MSVKVIAVVALAVLGTLAALHFVKPHHAEVEFAQTGKNGSHFVPNKVMMFKSYKQLNNLKFGAAEDSKRFTVFSKNVDIIQAHNAKHSSYKLGVTSLAHLTREEFAALKLGYNAKKHTVASSKTVVTPVKDSAEVDWVAKGAVTGVKNQGNCGSCWSFSTTGALEGLNYIKNHKLVSLSEQELVDCSGSYGNQGCNGGLMDQGFQYVADNGLSSEDSYPYTAVDGDCQTKTKVFKNKGHEDVPANDNGALVKAIAQQPVSVAIEADTSAFQLYAGGVLTGDACGTALDHGVLAVGTGKQDGSAYIKVKNSWGASWGLNGFVLIGQASGAGVCGINSAASYPTL